MSFESTNYNKPIIHQPIKIKTLFTISTKRIKSSKLTIQKYRNSHLNDQQVECNDTIDRTEKVLIEEQHDNSSMWVEISAQVQNRSFFCKILETQVKNNRNYDIDDMVQRVVMEIDIEELKLRFEFEFV